MAEADPLVLPDLPITTVRWRLGESRVTGPLSPLVAGHPATRLPCIGCWEPLGAGEPTAVLVIGPGGEPSARVKAARGGWHTATAVIVHAACAGADHTSTGRSAT